jgi:hypothetical protein
MWMSTGEEAGAGEAAVGPGESICPRCGMIFGSPELHVCRPNLIGWDPDGDADTEPEQ